MRYLTTLEKLVTLLVCVIVTVMCVKLMNALDPIEMAWIIPSSVVVISFITVLLLGINDARQDRAKSHDYNTLRKEIIAEKIESQKPEETILMVCTSEHKDINRDDCDDCRHSQLHMQTPDCEDFKCHRVGIVDMEKVLKSWIR